MLKNFTYEFKRIHFDNSSNDIRFLYFASAPWRHLHSHLDWLQLNHLNDQLFTSEAIKDTSREIVKIISVSGKGVEIENSFKKVLTINMNLTTIVNKMDFRCLFKLQNSADYALRQFKNSLGFEITKLHTLRLQLILNGSIMLF